MIIALDGGTLEIVIAVKAKFDGKNVILPEGFNPPSARQVVVVFDDETDEWDTNHQDYLASAEPALRKVWENPDDEVFNTL